MTLRLNGSTSGYSEIDAPAIAGDQLFTLPSTGGTLDRINRAGNILQVVNSQTASYASGATTIPIDDTIPQNTEGVEFLTATITPTSASSKLYILVQAVHGIVNATWVVGALFQDSTVNALNSAVDYISSGGTTSIVNLSHFMTSGTTSTTTFKYRAGAGTGNIYLNGNNSTRLLGGATISSITILEIAA
jgi:hypothetical protein